MKEKMKIGIRFKLAALLFVLAALFAAAGAALFGSGSVTASASTNDTTFSATYILAFNAPDAAGKINLLKTDEIGNADVYVSSELYSSLLPSTAVPTCARDDQDNGVTKWNIVVSDNSSNGSSKTYMPFIFFVRAPEGYKYTECYGYNSTVYGSTLTDNKFTTYKSGAGDVCVFFYPTAGPAIILLNVEKDTEYKIETSYTGEGTVDGAGTYYEGDTVTLTATPSEGYSFSGWLDGNTENPRTITATADKTYTAIFTANTYSITYELSGGEINGSYASSYTYGEGAALPTDVTKSGYAFDGWYESSDYSGSAVTAVSSTDLGNKTFYAKWVQSGSSLDFTSIRALRAESIEVDHGSYTIKITSVAGASNVALYTTEGDVIEGGKLALKDAGSASVTTNSGSYYINRPESGTEATVTVTITVNDVSEDYTVTVTFADADFDFTSIRALRAAEISVDHSNRTIGITSDVGASNVALYTTEGDVIDGGKLALKDAGSASVTTNSGSYYINKPTGGGSATVTVTISIGMLSADYTVTVTFTEPELQGDALRLYERSVSSTQEDINESTTVKIENGTIYITASSSALYLGIIKRQNVSDDGCLLLELVGEYPTYSDASSSYAAQDDVYVDYQGCIFVKNKSSSVTLTVTCRAYGSTETVTYTIVVTFGE